MEKKSKNQPMDEFQTEKAVDTHNETAQVEDSGEALAPDPEDQQEELANALEKEKEKFLRLFAEFENYKKRTTKERMELFKTAGQEVMVALLPVLDDFDRALTEIGKSADAELLKGVALIHTKMKETLRAKGLEEVNCQQGDVFDAEIHEAISQIPAPKRKLKGKIVEVIEKGYALGEKIIRHPKVVVGN